MCLSFFFLDFAFLGRGKNKRREGKKSEMWKLNGRKLRGERREESERERGREKLCLNSKHFLSYYLVFALHHICCSIRATIRLLVVVVFSCIFLVCNSKDHPPNHAFLFISNLLIYSLFYFFFF